MSINMTPAEVREIRAELGLTQAELGAAIGVDGRAVRRWESEPGKSSAQPIPEAMARILRLARKTPSLIKRLAAEADDLDYPAPDMGS